MGRKEMREKVFSSGPLQRFDKEGVSRLGNQRTQQKLLYLEFLFGPGIPDKKGVLVPNDNRKGNDSEGQNFEHPPGTRKKRTAGRTVGQSE